MLSKETIKQKYYEAQTSNYVKKPFDDFDLNHNSITVILGSCIFRQANKLIVLNGEKILAIEPPETDSSFPALSGCFTDESGKELFRIIRNEWLGSTDAWDLEIIRNEIVVRADKDRTSLHLRVAPPDTIEIVELNLRVSNSHLICKNNSFSVGRISSLAEYYIGIDRLECFGADIGVLVDEDSVIYRDLINCA